MLNNLVIFSIKVSKKAIWKKYFKQKRQADKY